jgi:hypothetical protein
MASVINRYGSCLRAEEMLHLSGARVFLVDFQRLWNDFPQLHPDALAERNAWLREMPEGEQCRAARRIAEAWLLEQAALVSRVQAAQSDVNDPIATTAVRKRAFRPPRYGRACVVAAEECVLAVPELPLVAVAGGGELDIKGVGLADGCTPRFGECSDGLLPLVSALEEYLYERLIERILEHAGSELTTLPHYALIDSGFDVIGPGVKMPAGLVVRRAHLRDTASDLPVMGSERQYRLFEAEMLLRRYGLYSSRVNKVEINVTDRGLEMRILNKAIPLSPAALETLVTRLGVKPPFRADRVNIQTDADEERGGLQIVDFGMYNAAMHFDHAVLSLVRNRPFGWGGFLSPAHAEFVQPDPHLVPKQPFWRSTHRFEVEHLPLIANFREGLLTSEGVYEACRSILATAREGWPSADRWSAGQSPTAGHEAAQAEKAASESNSGTR